MALSCLPARDGPQMPRVLRIDPRPTTYDSVAEATFATEDEGAITQDVERDVWEPVAPSRDVAAPDIAFVDGVERRDARVSAEGDGMPFAGMRNLRWAVAILRAEAVALLGIAVIEKRRMQAEHEALARLHESDEEPKPSIVQRVKSKVGMG